MTRIPLASNLKTRTGAPSIKDARIQNGYIEVKGNDSAVRKRPAAQGGVSVGTGQAQGGIGLNIGGTAYIYTVNGDTGALNTSSIGTTWSSGASYLIGDIVAYGFVNYWAKTNNTNSNPTTNPADWSTSYVPSVPTSITPTTLNSIYNGALSGGNLVFTVTNIALGSGYAISLANHTSGKYYFEATATLGVGDQFGVGLADSGTASSSTTIFGATTFSSSDILAAAIDLDGLIVYGYKNNVLVSSLPILVSAPFYAGISVSTGLGPDVVTVNFGQSAFTYSPPAGYTAGF